MAWTYTYDTTAPADSQNPSLGATRIREMKEALVERLANDHYFPKTGNEVSSEYAGEHKYATLREQSAKPTLVITDVDKGAVYTKAGAVSAKTELFYENEDGNELQLTHAATAGLGLLVTLVERAAKPTAVANTAFLYSKNDAAGSGATEVWIEDEAGNEVQVTYGGYLGTGLARLTGDQTIAGVKTFSSFLVLPSSNPTTDYQAAHKSYVDAVVTAHKTHLVYGIYTGDGGATKTITPTLPSGITITAGVWKLEVWGSGGADAGEIAMAAGNSVVTNTWSCDVAGGTYNQDNIRNVSATTFMVGDGSNGGPNLNISGAGYVYLLTIDPGV